MRESASWISLRQHIYISFTTRHPLTIDLTNYKDSSVFHDTTDEAWANRMIYCFAIVLNCVLHSEVSPHRWAELDEEIESWNVSKPWNFQPRWKSESKSSDRSPWSELLMSHPAHGQSLDACKRGSIDVAAVIALQYYHLAKMTLTIFDPKLSKLGFESRQKQKAAEVRCLVHELSGRGR